MYQPSQFRIEDDAELRAAMKAAPFATLVTAIDGTPTADHLPMLFSAGDGDRYAGRLRGHIARGNPLVHRLGVDVDSGSGFGSGSDGLSALAIFHGPQAYITPSWYPAKQEHGKVVPTWNYEVVHVHGRLRLIDDPAWLREVVGALTERFESDRPSPWSIDDAPADFIGKMCRAIVGVELTIERIVGKRKASQHKPIEERQAIFQGLQVESGYSREQARTLSGTE